MKSHLLTVYKVSLRKFSSNHRKIMENSPIYKQFDSLLVEPNQEGFKFAASLIQNGQLVGFPTETVYGLGANALNAEAVKSIFTAKGRPLTDPLIVHVADFETPYELIELKENEKTIFKKLSELFWPGPLTLIVKASSKIPSTVTANTGFVGIRYPNHPIACRLIKESKLPIAAPSANRFGHVSPTRALHVLADLGVKGVHVINGESESSGSQPCEYGIESTVAKIDGDNKQIVIFRQGAITQLQLENVLRSSGSDWSVVAITRAVNMHKDVSKEPSSSEVDGSVEEDVDVNAESVGQEAPGQAITHYAPDVPCFIVESLLRGSDSATPTAASKNDIEELRLSLNEVAALCVVIDYHGALSSLADSALAYRDLSARGDAAEAAHSLFDTLRWAEQVDGAKKVLVAAIGTSSETSSTNLNESNSSQGGRSEFDLTLGVADRVFRAASGQHVHLTLLD